jgi:lysozyme family protein
MTRNVATVVARVLEREGGIGQVEGETFVTRFGQTPAWLEEYGFVPPATAADAAVNYERWLAITRLEEICRIDLAVGDAVVDFAIHSGLSPAVEALQRAVGAKSDGKLGPVTFAAVAAAPAFAAVARQVLTARLRYLGVLLASMKTDRRPYARNWINRVASQIDALPA